MTVLWGDKSWDEIKASIDEHTVVILPAGTTEQHSLHLPVATDTYFGHECAKRAAESVKDKVNVLVLPPLHYGRSPEEQNWPGSIFLRAETYLNVIKDICDSIINYGVKRIILYSCHGNNPPLLNEVTKHMRNKHKGVIIGVLPPLILIEEDRKKIQESKIWGHACEIETSLMLYLFPKLVKKEKIRKPNISFYNMPGTKHVEGELYMSWRVEDFSDTGAFGNPVLATDEKGKILAEALIKKFGKLIVRFSQFERKDVVKAEI